MAIRFFNIRSGETQVAETEPQISALWASSDHSPNVSQGQDFGWRLAPSVVVEMKQVQQDIPLLTQIAGRMNKPLDDITEPDILAYISSKTSLENAPVADATDYQDAYDEEIRRLSKQRAQAEMAAQNAPLHDPGLTTTTTTESIADLEKRVELEERLAAAREKAVNNPGPITATTVKPKNSSTTPNKVK